MQVAGLTLSVVRKLGASLTKDEKTGVDNWLLCQYKAYIGSQSELVHACWIIIKDNGNLPTDIKPSYSSWVLIQCKLYVLKVVLAKLARVIGKAFRK